MYLEKLQDVVDSVNLIREYHDRSETKKHVNTYFTYKKNNYVFYYFILLNSFAPEFKAQYERIFGAKPLGKKKFWNQDDIRVQVERYVNYCYNSPDRLEHALNDAIVYYTRGLTLSSHELARMQALQRMPGSRYKSDQLVRFLKELQNRKPAERPLGEKGIQGAKLTDEEKEQLRQVVIPITGPATNKAAAIKVQEEQAAAEQAAAVAAQQPSPEERFADLGQGQTTPLAGAAATQVGMEVLQAQPETKTERQANLPTSQLRQGVQKFVYQGRQILKPAGEEALSRFKQAYPGAKQRAFNFLTRSAGNLGRGIISFPFGSSAASASRAAGAGLQAAGGAARGAAGAVRGVGLLARLAPVLGIWGVVIIIGLPILLFGGYLIYQQLLKTNADCLPLGCPRTALAAGGDIAACTFTRSGQAHPIKSAKLISYIQEVSAKSGIPPAVIAGIAMHESPDFVQNATDDHAAFGSDVSDSDRCKFFATSSSGALGLMQVQPPQSVLPIANPRAWSRDGIERGIKMVDSSRTFESVTMHDFCDVKTSLFLGAGVLISKNGGKAPQSGDEIETAVCKYYGGDCTYGSGFNYGKEVRKDWEACTAGNIALPPGGGGAPTQCTGSTPVTFTGATKVLLPLPNQPFLSRPGLCSSTESGSCGRPGPCIKNPTRIVLHVTAGEGSAISIYNFFANGALGRDGILKGTGSHFIVGKDGQIIQQVEMFQDQVEIAWAVANYSDHISIEMVSGTIYISKNAAPAPQYQATIQLVRELMRQYKIPLGSVEYTWKAPSDLPTPLAVPGIYGHYQLNPLSRSDPGEGFMRDIREDLRR